MAAISDEPFAYVRRDPAETLPPPLAATGALGWLRANLFSSPREHRADASLRAADRLGRAAAGRASCSSMRSGSGADRDGLPGHAPGTPAVGRLLGVRTRVVLAISSTASIRPTQRWRVDLFFVALGVRHRLAAAGCRRRGATSARSISSSCCRSSSFVLLHGAPPIGLAVRADRAVGRHARHPARRDGRHRRSRCRSASCWRSGGAPTCRWSGCCRCIFIEFVRGVPLITVLFMANMMLPLFVPDRLAPDKLVRALIGVALFASAYMAEVVRGGLAGHAARPVRGGAGARLRLLAHDGLVDPAAGAARDLAQHRQHLHRPVQGYDARLHRRHLRFPAHHRGGARRPALGGARRRASPAMPLPRCSTSSAAIGMSRYARSVEARLARAERR